MTLDYEQVAAIATSILLHNKNLNMKNVEITYDTFLKLLTTEKDNEETQEVL